MRLTIQRLALAALLGAALTAGCATGSAGQRAGSQRNLITNAELARAGDVSLYEALTQLRPTFLKSRGTAGFYTVPAPVQVYIGTLQMEGIDHLREIMAKNVKEVRFLEPQQANARFGGNNSGGALIIAML